jgi:hypothetical protein
MPEATTTRYYQKHAKTKCTETKKHQATTQSVETTKTLFTIFFLCFRIVRTDGPNGTTYILDNIDVELSGTINHRLLLHFLCVSLFIVSVLFLFWTKLTLQFPKGSHLCVFYETIESLQTYLCTRMF